MSRISAADRPQGYQLRAPGIHSHFSVLDGLRGLAIILVCIYHFSLFSGMKETFPRYSTVAGVGWIGVDLFFVLSGLLITGILLDSKDDQHYFRNFYGRRALRVFPVYYAFVSIFLIGVPLARMFAYHTGFRSDLPAGTQPYLWSYLYNYASAMELPGTGTAFLIHFWSLSVEEQFYLIWPFLVRVSRRRTLAWICGSLFIFSGIARMICISHGRLWAGYALTPCRIDTLAAGGLLAILLRSNVSGATLYRWACRIGMACLVPLIAVLIMGGTVPERSPLLETIGFPLLATLFACLLACCIASPEDSRLWRVFTAAPLRNIGLYSYGLYVVHQPIIFKLYVSHWNAPLLQRFIPWPWAALILFNIVVFGFALGVAALSWHLFESRILKHKKIFSYEKATLLPIPATQQV